MEIFRQIYLCTNAMSISPYTWTASYTLSTSLLEWQTRKTMTMEKSMATMVESRLWFLVIRLWSRLALKSLNFIEYHHGSLKHAKTRTGQLLENFRRIFNRFDLYALLI